MTRFLTLSFPAACVVMAIGASSVVYLGQIAERITVAQAQGEALSRAPETSPLPPRKP